MDLALWMEQPGLPADAPRTESSAIADVEAELARLLDGAAASSLETDGWVTQQWLAFLEGLDGKVDATRMAELDAALDLTSTGNSEILCVWLRLSAKHGYSAADERMEAFLARVGRAKFLKPIYKQLGEVDRDRALAVYESNRARYHSVATAAIDRILGVTN